MDDDAAPTGDAGVALVHFGRELHALAAGQPLAALRQMQLAFALIAYQDPRQSPLGAQLLPAAAREPLAQALNSCILGEEQVWPAALQPVLH